MSEPTVNTSVIFHPLRKVARELDKLSPEVIDLLALALTGANGEHPICSQRDQFMARQRLNEALTTGRRMLIRTPS